MIAPDRLLIGREIELRLGERRLAGADASHGLQLDPVLLGPLLSGKRRQRNQAEEQDRAEEQDQLVHFPLPC
jgi:hypothetical protein